MAYSAGCHLSILYALSPGLCILQHDLLEEADPNSALLSPSVGVDVYQGHWGQRMTGKYSFN